MESNTYQDICSNSKGQSISFHLQENLNSCVQSQFNQLVVQKKYKHEFVMEDPDGPPHNPTFNCVLKIEGSSYKGSGQTKKKAKYEAIEKYFEATGKPSLSMRSSPDTSLITPPSRSGIVEFAPSLSENYVGNLHELCAKSALPQPSYLFNFDPATKKYLVDCMLKDMITFGEHIAKKEAKKIASMNMIAEIGKRKQKGSSMSIESTESAVPVSPPTLRQSSPHDSPPSSQTPTQIPCFQKLLTDSENLQSFLIGADIFKIPYLNFHQLLLDLSKARGFQVMFEVEDSGPLGFTCIAQLGVFPVIVAVGVGSSNSESKNAASKSALLYIKATQ